MKAKSEAILPVGRARLWSAALRCCPEDPFREVAVGVTLFTWTNNWNQGHF